MEKDNILINKYLHGESEELLSIINLYIDEVLESCPKELLDSINIDEIRKSGFSYLDAAIQKHLARVKDKENGIDIEIPDFLTYYKWFARQGMIEYLNEVRK